MISFRFPQSNLYEKAFCYNSVSAELILVYFFDATLLLVDFQSKLLGSDFSFYRKARSPSRLLFRPLQENFPNDRCFRQGLHE